MRVLITIAPLSYREVLMFALRRRRSHVEVTIAGPDELDGEMERNMPELIICNAATRRVRDSGVSWVEVLVHDGMDANVCVGGVSSTVEDPGIEALLAIVDETEKLPP